MINKVVSRFDDPDVDRQFDLILRTLADLIGTNPTLDIGFNPVEHLDQVDQKRYLTYARYLRLDTTTLRYAFKLLSTENTVVDGDFEVDATTNWDYDDSVTWHDTTGGYGNTGRGKFTDAGTLLAQNFLTGISDGQYYLIALRIKKDTSYSGTIQFRLNVYDSSDVYLNYAGSATINSNELSSQGFTRFLALVEVNQASAAKIKPAVVVTVDSAGEIYVDDFWMRSVGTDIYSPGDVLSVTWNASTYGPITNPSATGAPSDFREDAWTHNVAFSSGAINQIQWTAGTIQLPRSDGTASSYSVNSNSTTLTNTDLRYIFADLSGFGGGSGELQVGTTWPPVGWGRRHILLAVGQRNDYSNSDQATYQVFGGPGGMLLTSDFFAANSIIANSIASDVIQTRHLTVNVVTADRIAPLTNDDVVVGTANAGGILTSYDFTTPNGVAAGVGWRLSSSDGLEAYGNAHAFGGPTFFQAAATDPVSSWLTTVGLRLSNEDVLYPAKANFSTDGQMHTYHWDTTANTYVEIVRAGYDFPSKSILAVSTPLNVVPQPTFTAVFAGQGNSGGIYCSVLEDANTAAVTADATDTNCTTAALRANTSGGIAGDFYSSGGLGVRVNSEASSEYGLQVIQSGGDTAIYANTTGTGATDYGVHAVMVSNTSVGTAVRAEGKRGYGVYAHGGDAGAAGYAGVYGHCNGATTSFGIKADHFNGGTALKAQGYNSGSVGIETYGVHLDLESNNLAITPEGGFAIKLKNATGATSVKGQALSASTSTPNAVVNSAADAYDCMGFSYESGIANNSPMWVVAGGIADVLLKNNTNAVTGNWVSVSDTAGRVDASGGIPSPPTAATHFREVGHALANTNAGTNVTTRITIHFL